MTHAIPIRREVPGRPLSVALQLAAGGVPVLPLRAGKLPIGNCHDCVDLACGGRPNMKTPGPCTCPRPCHGWAAASTDPAVLSSPAWAAAWRQAELAAYHPGGAGVTVVDLDDADAVAWARQCLPSTRTVPTTRGEHWIYRGAMPSANHVRPGVDIKSTMSYVRWLGPGSGSTVLLPPSLRGLVAKEESTPARRAVDSSSPVRAPWSRSVSTGCRHTDGFVRTGLERGLARVRGHVDSGAGSASYGVARFLAAQHAACPGPCGLDSLAEHIVAAAVSVGVPEQYARRAVTNGLSRGVVA